MRQPLISIIIVTYNAGLSLSQTIQSILVQTYTNIELIIIDGGSNDNTIKIIQEYAFAISYWISEKDHGIYDAMNKGITSANGDWLFFLGADDLLYTAEVLDELFTNLDLTNIELLYGDVRFKSNGRRFGEEKNYMKLVQRNICHQAIFYHANIFKKIGNYNLRYAIVADHELNIRIFRNKSIKKIYISQIISLFNDRGTSDALIDKHFYTDMLIYFLNKEHIPYFSPVLQQYHFYYGLIALINKQYILAARHIFVSWIRGNRKVFYFFYTGKFVLKLLFRKPIRFR